MLSLFFIGAAFFASETRAGNLPDSIPKGWRSDSINSRDVVIGTDTVVKRSGKASGFIRRDPTPSYGTGTIMQTIAADAYRNKRVRLTVYIKSKEVESALLHMRVDGPDTTVAFGNTMANIITDTRDWTLYQITLDVPEESRNIIISAALIGQGIFWMDDCKLEIVDRSIPSDDLIASGAVKSSAWLLRMKYQPNPSAINFNFEDQ